MGGASKWTRHFILVLIGLNVTINMAILRYSFHQAPLIAFMNIVAIGLGLTVGVLLGRSK